MIDRGAARAAGNSAPRIVSLVPSATETLLALGANVVACTRFCNQPHLPTVGGTKNPDVSAIVELRPDLVVVDTEENRREDADAIQAAGVALLVTSVRSVDDARDAVAQLATASRTVAPTDVAEPAETFTGAEHRAFVPIWRRPWMTINSQTYGASLLRSIGVDVVTAAFPDPYPTVELDAVAALTPTLILVPSEPYSFNDSHVSELRDAMPTAAVVRVDGEDLFWWGIRTPLARRRLADTLANVA